MAKTENKEKKTQKRSSLSLCKQIRDLRRLLQKQKDQPTLPPEVLEEKQEQLKELLQKKQQHLIQKRIKKYKKKYKYVRFVEEQKARRAIRKLQRQIQTYLSNKQSGSQDNNNNNNNNNNILLNNKEKEQKEISSENDLELEKLKIQLKKYEDDLLYILHFPGHVKYISLYPKVPMTNRRILRLQQSIREDLIKKRDMGLISLTKLHRTEKGSSEESSHSHRQTKKKKSKSLAYEVEKYTPENAEQKKIRGEFVLPTGSEQPMPVSPAEKDDFFIETDTENSSSSDSTEPYSESVSQSHSYSQSVSSKSYGQRRDNEIPSKETESNESSKKRKNEDRQNDSDEQHPQKKQKKQ
jgi:hypothetical protein